MIAISRIPRTESNWDRVINDKIKASSIPNHDNYYMFNFNTIVDPFFIDGMLNETKTGVFTYLEPLGDMNRFYKPRLNNSYFVLHDIANPYP